MFHAPDKYRIRSGPFASSAYDGNNGAFFVPCKSKYLSVISSEGEGWEHVSVSLKHRCPVWEEMCFIKDLFWDDTDCVIQYHPPRSDYVNNHEYCLHLWRPMDVELPRPPAWMVGLL